MNKPNFAMRSLFLVGSITIVSSVAYAQSPEGFKGANKIFVFVNTGNRDSLFTAVGKILVANDVPIESSNKEFYQFNTSRKVTGDYYEDISYTMTVAVEGNKVTIAPVVITHVQHELYHIGWYWTSNRWSYNYTVLEEIKRIFCPLGQVMFGVR